MRGLIEMMGAEFGSCVAQACFRSIQSFFSVNAWDCISTQSTKPLAPLNTRLLDRIVQ